MLTDSITKQSNKHRDAVNNELQVILAASGNNRLHPRAIVEFARDPKTALHRHFIWDDGEAAEKYRIYQARQLIRVIVIAPSPDQQKPIQCRAWYSLTPDRKEPGGGYREVRAVMACAEYKRQLVDDAKRDWVIYKHRYEGIRELAELFQCGDAIFGIHETKPETRKAGPAAN